MAKDKLFYPKSTLNLHGKILDLSTPITMGILNLTPDSFYDGGQYRKDSDIQKRIENMLEEGASIIDFGGASSRPGAKEVPIEEEIQRVIPPMKEAIHNFPGINISIDSFRSPVVRAALDAGAVMVNDISGGQLDSAMFETAAEFKVPYILMHMRGNPTNMHTKTEYRNLIVDITDYFQERINQLESFGVYDIIVDPGIGFAKTVDQNYEILRNLNYFKALERPILLGMSRKSTIYKSLDVSAESALNGTTVVNTIALLNGASILRVHDLKEAMQAIKLFKLTYP